VRRIVCDTGPLLHLHEADLLPLLQLAGDIRIPPVVESEITTRQPKWTVPEWVTVVPLRVMAAEGASQWQRAGLLDPGEAEALALARQIEPDWLLTDDAAARWIAQNPASEKIIRKG
jgi:predicted nucleic acid-binding protein